MIRKYTYKFKEEGRTYVETFQNDEGLEKNVKNAKALAKVYGWKLVSVVESR